MFPSPNRMCVKTRCLTVCVFLRNHFKPCAVYIHIYLLIILLGFLLHFLSELTTVNH